MTMKEVLNLEHFEILEETDQEEPGFLASMTQGFEKNSTELLRQLKESIQHKKLENYTFFVHKLKGLSGALGARLLSNLASEAEILSKSEPDFKKLEKILKEMDSAYAVCLDAIKKRQKNS